MNIEIKYGNKIENFEDNQRISIGDSPDCDFYAEGFEGFVELIYSEKYSTYVLVNSEENNNLLFNNKPFKKVLTPANFGLINALNFQTILFVISSEPLNQSVKVKQESQVSLKEKERTDSAVQNQVYNDKKDIFNNPIENNRIAIVKEIGYKMLLEFPLLTAKYNHLSELL